MGHSQRVQRPVEIPISEADWQRTPIAVQALVITLWERVRYLERRVAELEAQLLGRRRRGSSPPAGPEVSSGADEEKAPASPASKTRCSSGRSPGGQPGHEGHGHALLLADETVDVKPAACRQCGQPLRGEDSGPRRHQTIDIPPVQPRVIEYRLHTLRCSGCGLLTEAELPAGVPRSPFGASVHAWVGLLSGGYRQSKRNVQALLSDAFGLTLSPGTVCRLEQTVSEAVAAPVEDVQAYVQRQEAVNLDETSFRQGKVTTWLWTAATATATVFAIRLSRGREVVRELLGEAARTTIVGSDRYVAYGDRAPQWRQVCWAHLARNFKAFVERGGTAAVIGQTLLEQVDTLFHWWHRVRDGTLERSSFQTYMSGLRHRVHMELWYGTQLADAQTAATCREILEIEPAMYTFVRVAGVEPTNNAAERALRHGVIWRKTSFGTQSDAGTRYVERMLTVRETLRKQQRSMLAFLTQACQAAFRHTAAPSLLP